MKDWSRGHALLPGTNNHGVYVPWYVPLTSLWWFHRGGGACVVVNNVSRDGPCFGNFSILRLRQMRYLDAKKAHNTCRQLLVTYICNKSTNKDTSQYASTNNKNRHTIIIIWGLRWEFSMRLTSYTKGTLRENPPINEFLFTWVGFWRGCVP